MKHHWTEFDKTIRRLWRLQRANFLKPGALDCKSELPEFERIRLQNRKDMRQYEWLTVSKEMPEHKRIVILRQKLRKIESGIIRITGTTPGCYRGWRNSRDLNRLRKLLATRCYLLNQLQRPALKHIRISSAVYGICAKNDIAIPDLLRMNDFWCEVMVKHQHVVEQDGSRRI